jgi:hypothetical protein
VKWFLTQTTCYEYPVMLVYLVALMLEMNALQGFGFVCKSSAILRIRSYFELQELFV